MNGPGEGVGPVVADDGPGGWAVRSLARAGLAADVRWPWARVGRTTRTQGWKIHVTATPVHLARLVEVLAEECAPTRTPFKVACSPAVAALLCEGGLGDTQVGKTATVYPHDDAGLARLVDRLRTHEELVGPHVPDDVWLGGPVHVRYGAFDGVVRRDVLGQQVTWVEDVDGRLVRDAYDAARTWERFARTLGSGPLGRAVRTPPGPPSGLVADRYLVVGALRETGTGGLYEAFDTRADGVRPMILKHGRDGTMADLLGRDVRDRLRHQAAMHAVLAPLGVAPACDPCVDVPGGVVLPVEFQVGEDLESFVTRRLGGRGLDGAGTETRRAVRDALVAVGRHVAVMHGRGVVHRDLSPANVLRTADGTPLLSDLELAAVLGDPRPVHGKGTPGFMAPEQYDDDAPTTAGDVHAYGALVLFGLLGLDPRRLPRPEQSDGWASLASLVPSVPRDVWEAVAAAMDADPAARPAVGEVVAAVASVDDDAGDPVPPTPARRAATTATATLAGGTTVTAPAPARGSRRTRVGGAPRPLDDLVDHAVATLASPALLDPAGRWLSAPVRSGRAPASPEVRRGLNRGVAGPLYVCAGLLAAGQPLPDDVRATARRNAAFLVTDAHAPDHGMPGLHFGETGVLTALTLARAAGLSDHDDADVARLWDLVLDADPTWLDVTHGAAGTAVGLSRLRPTLTGSLAERVGRRVDRLLGVLVHEQRPDGSWVTPPGVDGMSGETLTGFAHGVAGIAYALVATHHPADGPQATRRLDAALRAGEWLLREAVVHDGVLRWRYGDRHPETWRWWCHGAPGVARLFARLHEVTGEARYRDVALACFGDVVDGVGPANLTLCHGLAGAAELMLDVAGTVGDPTTAARAHALARTVARRHLSGRRDVYWVVEDPDVVGADLMVGVAGIVHLLVRAVRGAALPSWDALGPDV